MESCCSRGYPRRVHEVMCMVLGSPWKLFLLALVLVPSATTTVLTCNNTSFNIYTPCTFSYPLPSLPQISVSPKGHVVRENGSQLTLTCNILAPPTSLPTTVRTFAWEFNGTVYRQNTSTLEILVSEETAGKYRCILGVDHVEQNTSLVTAVSNPVLVEPPRIDGWVNSAMEPTNQSQSTITKQLPQGGFTVLECQPRTNSPLSSSSASVTWLRNNVRIVGGDPGHLRLDQWRLLVRNFTLEGAEKEANYECIVAGLQYFNHDLVRRYTMTITEEVVNSSLMLPTDQVVASGRNVTFYCFTGSNKLSEVLWWKNGVRLNYTGYRLIDSTGPLVVTEMLVIQNVSSRDEGVYSCVGGAGKRYDATLTVVSPPTNGHILGPINIPHIADDIITGGSNITLTCLAVSGRPSGVLYQWYFRGEPVSANHQGIQVKNNVVTVRGGVNGTIQCFATNIAGTASASAILLNRPRPPTNLIYRPKNASDFKLVYGFSFNPPEEYIIDESFSGSFRVRTYTHRERESNGRVCTGSNIKTGESHREGGIDLPVQEYASNSLLYTVRMEVALLVDGVMSEFVALRLRSDNRSSCDVPIDIEVIKEDFISERSINQNDIGSGLWTLDFQWPRPKSALSHFLTECYTSLACTGKTIINNEDCKNRPTLLVENVSSCSRCIWNVTYSAIEGPELSDSVIFHAHTTAPTTPPNITSVSRAVGDGRTIDVAFTIPPQSCKAAEAAVHYSLATDHAQKTLRLLLDNCSLDSSSDSSPNSSPSSYRCKVEAECWDPFISLTYVNYDPSTGGLSDGDSPLSGSIQLPYITQDDLVNLNMTLYGAVHSTSVLLHLSYDKGLDCLLRPNSAYKVKVCWNNTSILGNSCVSSGNECKMANASGFVNISSLLPNTTYTYSAIVTGENHTVCGPQVILNTGEATPTLARSSTVIDGSKKNIYIEAGISCLAVVVLLVLIIFVCFRKIQKTLRKKSQDQHRYAPFQDDFREDAEDPIDIGQRQMDVHSETTSIAPLENIKDFIMDKYLRSQEQPDGSVGEPSMTDEYYLRQSDAEQESDMLIQADSDSSMEMGLRKMKESGLVKKHKKKSRSKKTKAGKLKDGVKSFQSQREAYVGVENSETDHILIQNRTVPLSDSHKNEQNQMSIPTPVSGGVVSSHPKSESGYVLQDRIVQEQEARQPSIASIPFTPPIVPPPSMKSQGEASDGPYVSEQMLGPNSSAITSHAPCISTHAPPPLSTHSLPFSPHAPPHSAHAHPFSAHGPPLFSHALLSPHAPYDPQDASTTFPTISSTLGTLDLPTSTSAPWTLNTSLSTSGYIANSSFPRPPPPIIFEGTSSSSSGYASQSVGTSSGFSYYHVEAEMGTSSGYVQNGSQPVTTPPLSSNPFSDEAALDTYLDIYKAKPSEESCSVNGNGTEFPLEARLPDRTDTQSEMNGFGNEQVDDNGSLSSSSVFSDSNNVCFKFTRDPFPHEEYPHARSSEGYCSMPTTPQEIAKFSGETAKDYINVNPKELKDVRFKFQGYNIV